MGAGRHPRRAGWCPYPCWSRINLSAAAGISAAWFHYSRAQHSLMNNSITFYRIKEKVKCLRQDSVPKAEAGWKQRGTAAVLLHSRARSNSLWHWMMRLLPPVQFSLPPWARVKSALQEAFPVYHKYTCRPFLNPDEWKRCRARYETTVTVKHIQRLKEDCLCTVTPLISVDIILIPSGTKEIRIRLKSLQKR